MNWKLFAAHVAFCVLAGGVAAFFLPVRWIAAAFWTSAALFINGSIAELEDAEHQQSGDGRRTSPFGNGRLLYWTKSIAVTAALIAFGFLMQFGFPSAGQ